MVSDDEIQKILMDPTASTWVRAALSAALDRDPVDAAIDAAVLSTVLGKRSDEIASQAMAKVAVLKAKRGRPTGPARSLRLDAHASKIDEYLAKGIAKIAIAKLLDVTPNTLYAWLKVRRLGRLRYAMPVDVHLCYLTS
jgi:hypothetical protein